MHSLGQNRALSTLTLHAVHSRTSAVEYLTVAFFLLLAATDIHTCLRLPRPRNADGM